MVVFGLGKDFLFKSILGRCELQQTQAQFVVFKNLLYSNLWVLPESGVSYILISQLVLTLGDLWEFLLHLFLPLNGVRRGCPR